MECPDENRVIEFIQGSLSLAESEGVEAHVAACHACGALVSAMLRHGSFPRASLAPAEVASDVLAAGTEVQRYRVEALVGSGTMGWVYAAFDSELQRRVCLKLLKPEHSGAGSSSGKRLLREARSLARLAHPNVVSLFDVGTWQGQVFAVMEHVEGVSLGDWLRARPREWEEIVSVFAAAGAGLAAAHAAGLVHRDFKPSNVLVGADGRVRVADFGLANAPDMTPSGTNLSSHSLGPDATALAGTPAYMSPEQFRGEPVDPRSDQFAFCVALYEALEGRHPFEGNTLSQLQGHIALGQVRPFQHAGLPPAVRAVLLKGLKASAAQRAPSMPALLKALEQRSPSPGRKWLVGAAVGAGLLVVTAGVRFLTEDQDRCRTSAAAQLRGVWDPQVRAQAERAFAASRLQFVKDLWTPVSRQLDAYASSWVQQSARVCRESGTEPNDRQQHCYERRLRALGSFSTWLREGEPKLEHSLEGALALGQLEACSAKAGGGRSLPQDPLLRASVERLRADVDEVELRFRTARIAEAKALLAGTRLEVEALKYEPLQAELLLVEGGALLDSDGKAAAEPLLVKAIALAEANRDDEVAAQGWLAMLNLSRAQAKAPALLGELASAAVARLGSPPRPRALLELGLGLRAFDEGRYGPAAETLARATELCEAAFGPHASETASALSLRGLALQSLGKEEQAIPLLERAVAATEQGMGVRHPELARILSPLGNLYYDVGRRAEGLAALRRALAVVEAAVPEDSVQVLDPLIGLSRHLVLEEDPSASAFLERALALRKAKGLYEQAGTVSPLALLGRARFQQGREEDGMRLFREAVALGKRTFGEAHVRMAVALLHQCSVTPSRRFRRDIVKACEGALAVAGASSGPVNYNAFKALLSLGRLAALDGRDALAAGHFKRAIQLGEALRGEDSQTLAAPLLGLGESQLRMGQRALGVASLARAARLDRGVALTLKERERLRNAQAARAPEKQSQRKNAEYWVGAASGG